MFGLMSILLRVNDYYSGQKIPFNILTTSPVKISCSKKPFKKFPFKGSGCGEVGRMVAYDTRGPGFESSNRQLILNIYLLLTVCRKDENKEKRPGMAHFF